MVPFGANSWKVIVPVGLKPPVRVAVSFRGTPLPTTTVGPGTTSTTIVVGPGCGNGVIDSGEQCDGQNFGNATCPGGSPGAAFLICTSSCTIDYSNCPEICGDCIDNNQNGLTDFEALRRRGAGDVAVLYAFDLLEYDGNDLRSGPLETRKASSADGGWACGLLMPSTPRAKRRRQLYST